MVMHLEYHQERMNRNSRLQLHPYIKNIPLPKKGIYKLRISYAEELFSGYTLTPYIIPEIKTLKLVIDNTIDYSMKSENRQSLNKLFELRKHCDDILIVKNGKITDTSFCNILLFDGNRWVTPASPLLEGTCRARLIKNGTIIPLDITAEEFKYYIKFMLINALLDFDESRSYKIS